MRLAIGLIVGLAAGFLSARYVVPRKAEVAASTHEWRRNMTERRIGLTGPENAAARAGRLDQYKKRLSDHLGIPVSLVQTSDYAGLVQGITSKQIDMAIIGASGYAAMVEESHGNVEPLVTNREVDGSMGYYAALFVRADGPIHTFADLKGKTIAYPDANSTSGYLFPRHVMRQRGIDPDAFFAKSGFAGGHVQAVVAVMQKQYDAGVTWTSGTGKLEEGYSRGIFRQMALAAPPQLAMKDVRIIELFGLIPNGPVVVRKDMPQEAKDILRGVLTTLHYEDRTTFESVAGGQGQGYVPIPPSFYQQIVQLRAAEKEVQRNK